MLCAAAEFAELATAGNGEEVAAAIDVRDDERLGPTDAADDGMNDKPDADPDRRDDSLLIPVVNAEVCCVVLGLAFCPVGISAAEGLGFVLVLCSLVVVGCIAVSCL